MSTRENIRVIARAPLQNLSHGLEQRLFFCLFDLILYIPSTIFQLNRDGSAWVEPVLS